MKKYSNIIAYKFLGKPLSFSSKLKRLRWGDEEVELTDAEVSFLKEKPGIMYTSVMFDKIKEKNGVSA